MVMMAAAMPTVRDLEFVMLSLSKLLPLCLLILSALAATQAANAQNLPPEIDAALLRARIPKDAISLYVIGAEASATTPLLSHRATSPMNPASVMKLVTSVAALDLLGPAYTWQTQVLVDPAGKDGLVKDGVLNGNLIIKGGGDPKLVVERLWMLLTRVRGLGITAINGDIVLDSSNFDVPDISAAAFDGEPMRPYNASPDALLVNFKSIVMTFTPMAAEGVARVQYDPPLYGLSLAQTVSLTNADCSDYRASLKANFLDAKRIRFLGSYPRSCGERIWPIAYVDPSAFAGLAVRGLWEGMGGKLSGTARAGQSPMQARPLFAFNSQTLGEVMRDMNKFSNNVMAQQIFLSLSLNAISGKPASFGASRTLLANWWQSRFGTMEGVTSPIVDNGSGLSRDERITAQSLGRMLQYAYAAPYMPELLASLPQTGIDGTLRRSKAASGGAHLKTGSLNNVVARAGYVDAVAAGREGRRYVLVAIVNSNDASVLAGTRAVLDTLIDWTAKQ
jgi:serine-type D-Ala-D-Ala carboxypeptidase/endopeptidase (penicillin-binding protein 4)